MAVIMRRRMGMLFPWHMRDILLVLVAGEFENFGIQLEMHFLSGSGPGFGVGFGIVNCRPNLHVAKTSAAETLLHVQRFSGGTALLRIEPSRGLKRGGVDEPRAAV